MHVISFTFTCQLKISTVHEEKKKSLSTFSLIHFFFLLSFLIQSSVSHSNNEDGSTMWIGHRHTTYILPLFDYQTEKAAEKEKRKVTNKRNENPTSSCTLVLVMNQKKKKREVE